MILDSFMCANGLGAVDLQRKSHISYTYFCHAHAVYSWIDHVLCPSYGIARVDECTIVNHHPDKNSDHLPLQYLLHTGVMLWSQNKREAHGGQFAASKIPSHGNSKYFSTQSHNGWHRTTAFQIQNNVIARCLQGSSDMIAR